MVNRKALFFIVLGMAGSCMLEAAHATSLRNEVVIRHFGAEDDLCLADGDLDFKPWYHRHEYYDACEESRERDPTWRLDVDSSWPTQREEYSDYLLRRLND